VVAALAVVTGAALAVALPAGAAVSTQSPSVAVVQIGSPGLLNARGVSVTVPVNLVCSPGASGSVYLQVTERVGSEIAQGSGWADLGACSGSLQTVSVTVTASGKAFRKGTAFASANFYVLNSSGFLVATDQRNIALVNK
jgi:hypothetical protein